MGIICDGKKKKLCQSHEKYIKKVLDMFNMKDAKLVDKPLACNTELNVELCPCYDKEKE